MRKSKPMSTREVVEDILHSHSLHFDQVILRKGIVTVRKGFFYTNGMTSGALAGRISIALGNVRIIEHDMIWKNFSGGAPLARQSHFLVRFKFI
jgi:hypothetical protein